MAKQSLLRAVEHQGVVKWPSFKDVSAFGSPLKDTVTEESSIIMDEHGFHGHLANLSPSQCDSAPPNIEGSFSSDRTHLIDQNSSANPSVGDFRGTLRRVESNEEVPSELGNFTSDFAKVDLNKHTVESINSFEDDGVSTSADEGGDGALQGSSSTHKEENEEDCQPPRVSQEVSTSADEVGDGALQGSSSTHKEENEEDGQPPRASQEASTSADEGGNGVLQGSSSTHKEENEEDSQPPLASQEVSTFADEVGDGALQRSSSTHKEENEEDGQPPRASQEVAESSVAATAKKNTNLANRYKSSVDHIQADFPRTPSPVFTRSHSYSYTKTDGLPYSDANAISLKSLCVNKTSKPSSHSSETTQSGVTLSTCALNIDKTEPSDNKYNLRYSSALETPRINSTSNSENNMSQEKLQFDRKNVPKLHVSSEEDSGYHRARGPTNSQGMHQLPGFAPPYREASSSFGSGNHFFQNHQPSSLYSQQYNLAGHPSSSTLYSPFMTGYSSHGLVPFSPNPSYVGVTTGVSAPDGIAYISDVRQQGKFYGQHVSMPQHSHVDYLHVQFSPQPFHEVYGSSSRSSSSGVFGNHFAQPESTYSAYMGDQKFHILPNGNLNVSIPIPTAISGYENSPFNVMSHFPSSSLAAPIAPPSSVMERIYTGHQSEMQQSQGSIRNMVTRSEWQGKRDFGDSDGPKKLSSLEEVKSGNAQKIELSNIEGCVIDFSVDQHGSRFIQQKLEHCTAEEKVSVFKEVILHAPRLIVDVFGNYVVQKLLELGNSEQRKELADALSGKMPSLSLHMYGCRVIQKALDFIELDQKLLLVKELDGHVMKCVQDQNGNHVIQKCIECLPTKEIGFIIASFQSHVPQLASHPYGCRVIQRVLEKCLDHTQVQCIINEILESSWFLAQDQYGNYVIQHILKWGKVDERSQIIKKLAGRVVQLSHHKFASNVIEKCLEHGNIEEKKLLIDEILNLSGEKDNLLAMMKDPYANYVVQKIFKMGNEKQREILLKHSRLHIHALKKYTFGKHIAALIEQLPGAETGVA